MPPSRHILSFAEYAAIRHATPYVVDVAGDRSRLLLFGGRHSSDPADPMFDQIEAAFVQLAPGFALHEGTPPAVETDREIAIRRHGEAGLIRHLAARIGIDTGSMDIPLAKEARLLRRAIGPSEALVFLVVRQLASFNRKTARMDFDGYFAEFFAHIAPALELATIDWPLIEAEHRRVLGRPLAPRRVTASRQIRGTTIYRRSGSRAGRIVGATSICSAACSLRWLSTSACSQPWVCHTP